MVELCVGGKKKKIVTGETGYKESLDVREKHGNEKACGYRVLSLRTLQYHILYYYTL